MYGIFTHRQTASGFVAGFWWLHGCRFLWFCCCGVPAILECRVNPFPIPMSGWHSCALTNADLPALNFRPLAGLFLTAIANGLEMRWPKPWSRLRQGLNKVARQGLGPACAWLAGRPWEPLPGRCTQAPGLRTTCESPQPP